jgi:hypothetical protein
LIPFNGEGASAGGYPPPWDLITVERTHRVAETGSEQFPEGVVFISGPVVDPESSSRPALYISKTDFPDLRDIDVVIPRRQLKRYEIARQFMNFDVYVEDISNLPLPFSIVFNNSHVRDGIRIASPEHVQALKSEGAGYPLA